MTEFSRIFTPRTEKAVKAISLLTNGVRYNPTEEETNDTLEALKSAVNDIAELYGILPSSEGDPDTESHEEATSKDRIESKQQTIKRSAFDRLDVDSNVRMIPEAQLTAYATHIVARLCEKFEDPEAQPKNYEPKED